MKKTELVIVAIPFSALAATSPELRWFLAQELKARPNDEELRKFCEEYGIGCGDGDSEREAVGGVTGLVDGKIDNVSEAIAASALAVLVAFVIAKGLSALSHRGRGAHAV